MDALKGLPTQTKTGRSIALYANIGQEGDLPGVLENDAEGIGLFRSEFLYLRKTTIQRKKISLRLTKKEPRHWDSENSSFAPLILGPINGWGISTCRKRKTLL